jgi:acetoin utilization deacetylase AcuC-like enzyme
MADAGRRVAVIDIDIHHGNGTQATFWRDPSVLTVSVHEHPAHAYPYYTGYSDERGAGNGRGSNVNVTVPPQCSDDMFVEAGKRAVRHVAEFEPDVVVVALGLDGLADDPLSATALTADAYAAVGREIAALGAQVQIVQEGGYALRALRPALRTVMEAFL